MAAETFFDGPDNPQKLPLPVGISTPFNTWFLGPRELALQTASRSVLKFLHCSRTWSTNRQTDRQTDHATQTVPILLRCGIKT